MKCTIHQRRRHCTLDLIRCLYIILILLSISVDLTKSNRQRKHHHNQHDSQEFDSSASSASSTKSFGIYSGELDSDGEDHGGGRGVNHRQGRKKALHQQHHHKEGRSGRDSRGGGHQHYSEEDNDVSLWINEQDLKMLSLFFMAQPYASGRMYAIQNGQVNFLVKSKMFESITIPSEVNCVNFTWKSGNKKYLYNFDLLRSLDDSILKAPSVSIKTKGRIPKQEKTFSLFLPCAGINSGTAVFNIGLSIANRKGRPLPGTPLRLTFKKECAHRGVYDSLDASSSNPTTLTTIQGPDPDCNLKCGNNGYCRQNVCHCNPGYTGQYCQAAFCFPQCLNGGNCTAPSICTCPEGYQGTQCEGGICIEKCLNRGKCIQKDTCQCTKGYYGLHCEFSKCSIPCRNGGRCTGPNKCRCPKGLGGDHCEIGRNPRSLCNRRCRHGKCMPDKTCKCNSGFYGRYCKGVYGNE